MSGLKELIESLKPKDTKSAIISYRTTERNKELMKQIAKGDGMSVNEMINEALLLYFRTKLKETNTEK